MRALIVSYSFPPVGGAGVQRVVKLVKYLPEHGVTPSVLTVGNPSVPLRDASLEADIPPGTTILRAPTFEPGYAMKRATWSAVTERQSLKGRLASVAKTLLVPDPQILWQPAAQLALLRRLRSTDADDVVLISGPPFSQFLLAPLARAAGAAVVLDYRDEWSTLASTYEMMGPLARRTARALEPRLLACADAVTTATEAFRQELLARFSFLSPERVVTIENGYDSADFPESLPEPPADRFVITYAGTVFRLTSARGLIAAVRLLAERSPELARKLDLRFIGRVVESELDYFDGSEQLGVRRLGYVPHERVIGELSQSHLVLCMLDDVPGAERIYPAKIFELMRLGRPTLVLAPPGALTELARRHSVGEVVAPRDVPAIAEALEKRLRAFTEGRSELGASAVDVERFDRRRLAGRFAEVFAMAHQVTRCVPRANRQNPTTAAAFNTTKLRDSLPSRPPRVPRSASA